jgi:hypothetical protein
MILHLIQYKLNVDWDESAIDYTCFVPKNRFPINRTIASTQTDYNVPTDYIVRN